MYLFVCCCLEGLKVIFQVFKVHLIPSINYNYIFLSASFWEGFPGSSAGKESTCNAGDPGLIPGLGRSPGEVIGYTLQYSWAPLVAQTVKNLPAVQEIWV